MGNLAPAILGRGCSELQAGKLLQVDGTFSVFLMLRIACGISKPSKHGLGLWVWMILPGDTLAHLQNNRRLPNLCSLFLYEPPTPTRPSPCRGGSFPPVCECGTTPASSHRGCWTGSSRLCRSCATSSSSKRGGGGQAQLGEPCGHGSPWTQTRREAQRERERESESESERERERERGRGGEGEGTGGERKGEREDERVG